MKSERSLTFPIILPGMGDYDPPDYPDPPEGRPRCAKCRRTLADRHDTCTCPDLRPDPWSTSCPDKN